MSAPVPHPHYHSAICASSSARCAQADGSQPCEREIPAIEFSTEDWTRRSMALNGMRMSTEYFASGSTRILTLIEHRLQAGQSDVVHDVLVYLWERILEVRAAKIEARTLQAESLAAYLGLKVQNAFALFSNEELSAEEIARKIESGSAGAPRRALNVQATVENLLARLQPELDALNERESGVLQLIHEIVRRLDAHCAEENGIEENCADGNGVDCK